VILDLHCYKCNDATLSPNLASQLAVFGINVQQQKKTEKSLTEMQIEHNLSYDFSVSDEKTGKLLTKLFGPYLTGLSNLGNSCYMASVLQVLFSFPSFKQVYGGMAHHADECPEPLPAECLECQLRKIGDGLLSGRYSIPDPAQSLLSSHSSPALNPNAPSDPQSENEQKEWQRGLRPTTFKGLVGRGHPEFSTMRQQDSEEFLGYLVTSIRRYLHRYKKDADPTKIFSFGMEQRLQCRRETGGCGKVRYRVDGMDVLSVGVPAINRPIEVDENGKEKPQEYEPVELVGCIEEGILGREPVDGWQCPGCSGKGGAWK
jgi:ubiquitin carboxyl-terminal hydrolase 5/13